MGLAAGDFLVNDNIIGNTSRWQTGVYGNGRDFTVAMGGNVTQQGNSSVYNFNIGTVSFSIDAGTIGSYGTVTASNGAKIQYTIIEDPNNPGCPKTLINLQDAANASAKSGYGATYAWDLGEEGGSFYINLILGHVRKESFIPKSVAASVYNPDGVLASGLAEITPGDSEGALGDIIAGMISGAINKSVYNDYLKNGTQKFVSTYEDSLMGISLLGYTNQTTKEVDSSNIGYFYKGEY